jgi:hypothetical protein
MLAWLVLPALILIVVLAIVATPSKSRGHHLADRSGGKRIGL